MAISYNLKFVKENLIGKKLIEKEGEIVFDRKFFKLKGKGAHDQGEQISYTDIKDYQINKEFFIFSTFSKSKYLISKLGSSFEDFLRDFFKLKNEFFAESLMMKNGMLAGQFECTVEVSNQSGNSLNKGRSLMQIYDQSIVFIPELADCFAIHFNFMKIHEFDDSEYLLTIEGENGLKIRVSRLGSSFVSAQETLERRLEIMYQQVLNQLKILLPDFALPVLLKLAYLIKAGKAVSMRALKKIDAVLPAKMLELAWAGANNAVLNQVQDDTSRELFAQKVQFLRSLDKDEELFLGFSLENGEKSYDVKVKSWFICALPHLNIIVVGRPNTREILFFRILAEEAMIGNKLPAAAAITAARRESPSADIVCEYIPTKVLEINQSMTIFGLDLLPLYKGKEELKKSRFRVAVMKLNYLRVLRRTLAGKSFNSSLEQFKTECNKLMPATRS